MAKVFPPSGAPAGCPGQRSPGDSSSVSPGSGYLAVSVSETPVGVRALRDRLRSRIADNFQSSQQFEFALSGHSLRVSASRNEAGVVNKSGCVYTASPPARGRRVPGNLAPDLPYAVARSSPDADHLEMVGVYRPVEYYNEGSRSDSEKAAFLFEVAVSEPLSDTDGIGRQKVRVKHYGTKSSDGPNGPVRTRSFSITYQAVAGKSGPVHKVFEARIESETTGEDGGVGSRITLCAKTFVYENGGWKPIDGGKIDGRDLEYCKKHILPSAQEGSIKISSEDLDVNPGHGGHPDVLYQSLVGLMARSSETRRVSLDLPCKGSNYASPFDPDYTRLRLALSLSALGDSDVGLLPDSSNPLMDKRSEALSRDLESFLSPEGSEEGNGSESVGQLWLGLVQQSQDLLKTYKSSSQNDESENQRISSLERLRNNILLGVGGELDLRSTLKDYARELARFRADSAQSFPLPEDISHPNKGGYQDDGTNTSLHPDSSSGEQQRNDVGAGTHLDPDDTFDDQLSWHSQPSLSDGIRPDEGEYQDGGTNISVHSDSEDVDVFEEQVPQHGQSENLFSDEVPPSSPEADPNPASPFGQVVSPPVSPPPNPSEGDLVPPTLAENRMWFLHSALKRRTADRPLDLCIRHAAKELEEWELIARRGREEALSRASDRTAHRQGYVRILVAARELFNLVWSNRDRIGGILIERTTSDEKMQRIDLILKEIEKTAKRLEEERERQYPKIALRREDRITRGVGGDRRQPRI